MIDTVILKISRNDFVISTSAYPNFSQSICAILDETVKTGRFAKSNYTLPKELKQSGLYFPRFSVMKSIRSGGYEIYAHIEFSAPKILFGNNFDEFVGDELEQVCETLAQRLALMGIIVRPEILSSGAVSRIHYGKNIPFTDYTTASQIIGDLAKCDITIRKHHNTRDFANGGEALYLQTANTGLVIYDKKQELKTTQYKKGRFESDNQCQFHILEQLKQKPPFEVVRIELRLQNPRAIRNTFSKCGIASSDGRFCDLFSQSIAKTVLLEAFSPFTAGQNHLINFEGIFTTLTAELKRGSPEISPRDIITIVGLKALLGEVSFRDIRTMTGATSGQWYRLKQTINKAKLDSRRQSSVDAIKQNLEDFQPIKLEDYILHN